MRAATPPPHRRATRWWRANVLPAWRAVRPLAVVTAGLSAIVLGTAGYLEYEPADYGFIDSLYRAIGLFGLSGAVDPPVPTTLEVARILAPAITGYAAVRGLLALSREQVQLAAIRLLARDHVVVAGLGTMGWPLATAFHDADFRVVAIELDPANPHAASARERGITVVTGDASDPALLVRTGAARARHLVLTCGEDGTNVDAATAAGRLAEARRSGVLTALVHLDDLDLWRALSAEAVAGSRRAGVRVEFFNAFATAARLMVERHPPFGAPDGEPRRPHVLLVGLDGVAEQLVVQIAGSWRAGPPGPGDELRLTVGGRDAGANLDELLERHPALAEVCRVGVREHDLDSAAFREGAAMAGEDGSCDVTFAYVCLARESEAMAAALALHARPDSRGVPVVVAVADAGDGVGTALAAEGGRLEAIEPFGVLGEALSPSLLLGGTTELLARAKHEEYVRAQRALGISPEQNPSMAPWEELPDSLRESNRQFADGIGRKLEVAGCAVVPAPLGAEASGFAFDDGEVEDLARQEHERWMEDLLRDGWRPTGGPKDPERKLHPLLVPWERLPEAERDKDRQPVREIPAMLARTGLRVHRATPRERR